MIKYIMFDLADVIVSGYYGVEKTIANMLNQPAEEIDSYLMCDEFCDLNCGKITEEEYIQSVLKKTNWDITIEQFKKIIRDNHNKQIMGTAEIIEKLSEKYGLVLLSDNVKEWVEEMQLDNNILNKFDKKYFSYDLSSTKAEAQTFQKVLQDLKTYPEQIIFIDDSKNNIAVAKSLNIEGILFENAKQLEQELIQKNIL